MNEEKKTPEELIKFLKMYSDAEMVRIINFAKQDAGAKYPEVTIPYEDLLAELEKRGIDCSHVNDYDGYLNEMVIELKVMAGKKRLFANWMLLLNEDDFARYIEQSEKDDLENEDELSEEVEFGVYCPICDEVCECGHIIAIYDRTYKSFEGGDVYEFIGAFQEIIEEGFRHFIQKGKRNPVFTLRSLKECWDHFISLDPKPEDEKVQHNHKLVNEVILDVLRYQGADWSTNEIANTGPGFSSSERFLFANNTMIVIKDSLKRLRKEFPGLKRK